MLNTTCSYLRGIVIGISVSGNGIDNTSAELIVRFEPSDGSPLAAYRLGAGSANVQFMGTVALATFSYENSMEVIISVNQDPTPTILCIALINKK